MNDRKEFKLQLEQAHDPLLEARPEFGPGDEGHISDVVVEAWLGSRPVAYDVRRLLKANKTRVPATFRLLDHHELWVVYFAFGINQRSNFKDVVCARLEVEYEDEPRVTIHQLFPTTEFTKWGEAGFNFDTEFQLSEKAAAEVPQKTAAVSELKGILPGASASLQVGAHVGLSVKIRVATPKLTAAGINNDYGLWEFRKYDVPLVGDHQVGHVLLVRKPVRSPVKAKLRLSVDVGVFSFWTSARSTEWVPVTIEP
jgi:hypothetical protein